MTITVKTVSVTYGRKFNLGDFNSATLDCTLWADVSDDQDLDEAMHALWDMAKENVKAQALPVMQKRTVDVSEVFLGLPIDIRDQLEPNGYHTEETEYAD